MKLLLVEDDPQLIQAIVSGLYGRYFFDVAQDGKSGLNLARSTSYDAIVLDIGIPQMSGLEVCATLRKDGNPVPILLLTGQFNSTQDIVAGLDGGADDYLIKPFDLEELAARLRALVRRGNSSLSTDGLEAGDIQLILSSRMVLKKGRPVELKRKEFDLLEYFVRNPNRVLTRAMIFDHIWGTEASGFNNTVDVHVKHLRDKLDKPFGTQAIQTVHGLGYKLVI